MMIVKLVNNFLRFNQLMGSIVLIAGYFLNDFVWEAIQQSGLDLTYEMVVYGYLGLIAFVVVLVPIRWIVEKIVEAKYLV